MIFSPHLEALIQGRANRLLRANVTATLSEFEITLPEWTFLSTLYESNEMLLIEIVTSLELELEVAESLIEILEKKELITVVSDSIQITAQGQGTVNMLELMVHKNLEGLMAGITEEELDVYFSVLKKIIANAAK